MFQRNDATTHAQAFAEGIQLVAGALGEEKGKDAATLQIAKEYIQM